MSHVDIDYSNLSGAQKEAKAIADIKEYLSVSRFEKAHDAFVAYYKSTPFEIEQLELWLMLPGISGYPVKAWFNLIVKEATK